MPEVSVIIPNYNHAKYLVQRIESVLNQTYQDFEVILMDDCSTDHSKTILDSYKSNPKITHVIYNDKNSGSTFKQWKKGVNVASGTYIWIAESDDWCEATLLETLVEGIREDKDCVISYCQSYCIENDNRVRFQSYHAQLSEMVDGTEFIQKYMSVPVAIFNASMALWRKEKFKSIPDEFTKFRFCGDWYFWIHIARLGKVHISAKVLNYFRKHDTDVSGRAFKSGLNFVEELKIIDVLYTENLITENGYYKAYKKKYYEYWLVKDTIDQTNKLLIKKLFSNPLSPKIKIIKLRASAVWKKLKNNRNNQ